MIDLANSPSFEDKAVLEFFETSGRNLLQAEATAGVGHHVALSIVGTDRSPDNGYFRAKVAQEKVIKTSGIPYYTILRSTQFMEFLGGIADSSADGNIVGEPTSPAALLQPGDGCNRQQECTGSLGRADQWRAISLRRVKLEPELLERSEQ